MAVQIQQTSMPYFADTTSLYHTLCGNRPHTLLLDSAEIQSKNSLKSLLFAQSALHISCMGQTVYFEPLHLDEDSKLKTTTIFDALRVVSQLFKEAEFPIYLGGLFSYDLVANFIPKLPRL